MRALERACSLHGVEFKEGSEVEDLILEKKKNYWCNSFMCHRGTKKNYLRKSNHIQWCLE